MNVKTLVMTVGLPRSGKSTWARQQGCPIVNPDAIRLALHGQRFVASAEPVVWAVAKLMVAALFRAGHDTVILDATNTTKARRDEWISPEWAIRYHVVPTPKDVCITRALAEYDTELVAVIERMAAQFDLLTETERRFPWRFRD